MAPYGVDTDDLFHAGMEHWWRRDRPTAVRLFRRVLDLDPHHADALIQLGIAAFDGGDLAAAERRFRAAVVGAARWIRAEDGFLSWAFEGNRPYLRAHQNLALVCRRVGRWGEAAWLHEQVLRWDPSDPAGLRPLLAEEVHRLGHVDRAIALHRRSREHAGALFSLGLALIEVGDPEEAMLALLRGMARNRYVTPVLLDEPWESLDPGESGDEGPAFARAYVEASGDLWDREPRALGELGLLWRGEEVRTWREDLDDVALAVARLGDRPALVERRGRLLAERRLRRLVAGLGRRVDVRVSGAVDVDSVAPATPIAWVADLRRATPALERRSGYPERARRAAALRITEAVTAWGHGDAIETAIRCPRRVDGGPCRGHVRAARDGDAVAWACTQCREGGRITAFEATRWDLSGAGAPTVAVCVALDGYAELEAIARDPEARRPIARALYRPDGAELRGTVEEIEALARSAEAECAPDLAALLRESVR